MEILNEDKQFRAAIENGQAEITMKEMRYSTLGNTGLQVSELGFGAAPLGDEYGTADPKEMARALHYSLDNGINIIDVAPYYGRTLAEARLGEIMQGRRHEVILATKCARYDVDGFDFSPAGIRR